MVVRRLLPSGQATDVIGTLESDGDPLVVERDGELHSIRRSDVVALKAIPPRPIRNRDIRALVRAEARCWPSLERAEVDGWLCRSAGSLPGGRANSAAPLSPAASLDRLDGVRAWYTERGLPLRLQWVDRLAGRDRPGGLDRESAVFVADGARIATVSPHVTWSDAPSPGWLALQSSSAVSADWVRQVIGAVRFGEIVLDGDVAAAVRLSLTRDGDDPASGTLWAGIGSLVVDERFRRHGLATDLLRALAAEGIAHGAERCFLEVLESNSPARAMYSRLGFTQHHRYGYWTSTAF
ncbi:GNAT family N-acetyltransferase [Tsukamurella soli]|uniref:GNAT family N-acetyltransferase n=1 Tax=Tsukamurella soli TaxID=644556 RepID=A0ABP8JW61_9ACTN